MRHGVKRIEGAELILVGTGRPCAAQEIGWTRLDCLRTEAHKRAEALKRQWDGKTAGMDECWKHAWCAWRCAVDNEDA